jgi:hypothetical protein
MQRFTPERLGAAITGFTTKIMKAVADDYNVPNGVQWRDEMRWGVCVMSRAGDPKFESVTDWVNNFKGVSRPQCQKVVKFVDWDVQTSTQAYQLERKYVTCPSIHPYIHTYMCCMHMLIVYK